MSEHRVLEEFLRWSLQCLESGQQILAISLTINPLSRELYTNISKVLPECTHLANRKVFYEFQYSFLVWGKLILTIGLIFIRTNFCQPTNNHLLQSLELKGGNQESGMHTYFEFGAIPALQVKAVLLNTFVLNSSTAPSASIPVTILSATLPHSEQVSWLFSEDVGSVS